MVQKEQKVQHEVKVTADVFTSACKGQEQPSSHNFSTGSSASPWK